MRYPNINAERARAGISVEQLAAELNVSRKTVYNWINSGKIPMDKLQKMSQMFRCSADYLLATADKSN